MNEIIGSEEVKSLVLVAIGGVVMWSGGWVRRFLAARVQFVGPAEKANKELNLKMDLMLSEQSLFKEKAEKNDKINGCVIAALDVLVKKVRKEQGSGEEYNGDLVHATKKINDAKCLYDDLRYVGADSCKEE